MYSEYALQRIGVNFSTYQAGGMAGILVPQYTRDWQPALSRSSFENVHLSSDHVFPPPALLGHGQRTLRYRVMDRYREKSSMFFTRLTNGLGKKQRPAVVPLSESLGSPAPQTSLSTGSRISPSYRMLNVNLTCSIFAVFELPDELILSILSHASPDPQLTGHYARFRVQYCMWIDDYHEQRVRFLLPLSMTCRMMRLRLLPWIWERLECLRAASRWGPDAEGDFPKGFNAIMGALRVDTLLAASVKYFRALLSPWVPADSCPPKVCGSVFHVG